MTAYQSNQWQPIRATNDILSEQPMTAYQSNQWQPIRAPNDSLSEQPMPDNQHKQWQNNQNTSYSGQKK